MKTRTDVSKALWEVWRWKDACYRDVADLPRRAALLKLLEDAEQTAVDLKLRLVPLGARRVGLVAEERGKYGR